LELQFEALKSQLSPHYLFNCLNTISSLVHRDPKLTESFIRRLAQTYQYILNTKNRKLVKLAEEIEFVKAYNYLLRVRFEEALKINIDLPEELLASDVPPLTLQILVENAVKHNVISEESPLEISIKADPQTVTVSNNLTRRADVENSFKVGLENIKKRYEFFTEIPVRVVNNELFEVQLPVLNPNF